MKKIGITGLVFMVIVLMTAFAKKAYAAENYVSDEKDYKYEILEDGTVQITEYIGTSEYVKVPEKIAGRVVTSIGSMEGSLFIDGTFRKIILPDSIKKIESGAFSSCTNLEEIVLSANLEVLGIPKEKDGLGSGMFNWCYSLKSIQISDANPYFKSVDGVLYSKDGSILYYYPANKPGENYEFPSGVKEIWNMGTAYNLKRLTFPGTVKKIGCWTLNDGDCNCAYDEIRTSSGTEEIEGSAINLTAIQDVYISDTIRKINAESIGCPVGRFHVDEKNPYYTAIDGCLYSKDGKELLAVGREAVKNGEFRVPSGVETVYGTCNRIGTLYIPETVKEMDESIGAANDIIVDPRNSFYCDINGVLFTKDKKTLLFYPRYKNVEGKYIVPEGVERLGDYAFKSSELKELVLPNTVKIVDGWGFAFTNMKVTIPSSVTELGCNSYWGTGDDFTVYCVYGSKAYQEAVDRNKKYSLYYELDKAALTAYIYSPKEILELLGVASEVVQWASSDTGIVSVRDGVLTPKKEGTAVITATYQGKTYSCNVTVKCAEIDMEKILAEIRKKRKENKLISRTLSIGNSSR